MTEWERLNACNSDPSATDDESLGGDSMTIVESGWPLEGQSFYRVFRGVLSVWNARLWRSIKTQ